MLVVRMGHRLWADGRCLIREDSGVEQFKGSHRHLGAHSACGQSGGRPPFRPGRLRSLLSLGKFAGSISCCCAILWVSHRHLASPSAADGLSACAEL